MASWVAKFVPEDMPFEEEVYLAVDGQEYGFVVIDSDGNTYTDFPFMTEEEARESIKETYVYYYSSFEWIDKDKE